MTEAERQQMSDAFKEWERIIKREVAEAAVRATIEACADTAQRWEVGIRSGGSAREYVMGTNPAPIVSRVLGGGE